MRTVKKSKEASKALAFLLSIKKRVSLTSPFTNKESSGVFITSSYKSFCQNVYLFTIALMRFCCFLIKIMHF